MFKSIPKAIIIAGLAIIIWQSYHILRSGAVFSSFLNNEKVTSTVVYSLAFIAASTALLIYFLANSQKKYFLKRYEVLFEGKVPELDPRSLFNAVSVQFLIIAIWIATWEIVEAVFHGTTLLNAAEIMVRYATTAFFITILSISAGLFITRLYYSIPLFRSLISLWLTIVYTLFGIMVLGFVSFSSFVIVYPQIFPSSVVEGLFPGLKRDDGKRSKGQSHEKTGSPSATDARTAEEISSNSKLPSVVDQKAPVEAVKGSDVIEAQKTSCGVTIRTEYNIGLSAAIYVDVEIVAKNTLSSEVDGVTWEMRSKSGRVLLKDTWVGSNQRPHFHLNPKAVGVVPIQPGEMSSLVSVGIFSHQEFLIRDKPGSDGKDMKEIFETRLSETREKYSDVSCQILGFVKKMNF